MGRACRKFFREARAVVTSGQGAAGALARAQIVALYSTYRSVKLVGRDRTEKRAAASTAFGDTKWKNNSSSSVTKAGCARLR